MPLVGSIDVFSEVASATTAAAIYRRAVSGRRMLFGAASEENHCGCDEQEYDNTYRRMTESHFFSPFRCGGVYFASHDFL
jgi:hypothetical protein